MGKIKWSHAAIFYIVGAFTGAWVMRAAGRILGRSA